VGVVTGAAGYVETVEAVAVVIEGFGFAMTGDVVEEDTWGAEVTVELLWLEVVVLLPVPVLVGAVLTIGAVPSEGVG